MIRNGNATRLRSAACVLLILALSTASTYVFAATSCVKGKLISIAVTPASPTVPTGLTKQFTATGTYSCTNGGTTTANITTAAVWSSTNTAAASVVSTGSSAGLATVSRKATVGSKATIKATSGTIVGSTTLTAGSPTLTFIAVSPTTVSMAVGATKQFTAVGVFSDGTSKSLTSGVTWSSSQSAIATITSAGLAKGVKAGADTIKGVDGSLSSTASLTITSSSALTAIAITPTTASISKGQTQQYKAVGTYTGGSTADITTKVTWGSSSQSVASLTAAGLASANGVGNAAITAVLGAIASNSAALTVTTAKLTAIAVLPQNQSIASGLSVQFTATGTFTDGSTANITSSASWYSSNTSAASIAANGLATSIAPGAATISANSGSFTSSSSLTVLPAQLAKVAVSPANAVIAVGGQQQFTATGTYTDGTTQNLTTAVTWTSSDVTLATLDAKGVATGEGTGPATVTATSGGLSGSASITVNAAQLVSIAVTPLNPSAAKGTTQQFTATGTYSDGSTKDLTQAVSWSSTDPSVTIVSVNGLGSATAVGSTTIAATDPTSDIQGSDAFTVTPATITKIVVTPAAQTEPLGATLQMGATAQFTDGTTQDITALVQWSSSVAAVGSVSNSTATAGLFTSLQTGSTTITATSSTGIAGSTVITVTSAVLISITVTSTSSSIPLGTQEQFEATGTYADGTTQDLTSQAQWTSSDATVATVSAAGLANTVAAGTAMITASLHSVQGEASLAVLQAATLSSITITPNTAAIPLGTTQQFTAIGNYSDGTTKDITVNVQWSTSDATVSTISVTSATAGLASTVATGAVTVTAASGGVNATAQLAVTPAALGSITVTPNSPTISVGSTEQFTATGSYTDGSTADLTALATWNSSQIAFAIVSNFSGTQGLATSAGTGQTTITASYGSVSGQTTLTVGAPALQSLSVTPPSSSILVGGTQQVIATGTYADGSTQNLTSSVAWSSSNTQVVTVSAGLAVGVSAGSAILVASAGTLSAQSTLTVAAATPTLQAIIITPTNYSIFVGGNLQLTATGTYSDGSTQTLSGMATWSSSATGAVTISASGLASALAQGSSTISASLGGVNGSTTLTVSQQQNADIYVATNGNDSWSGTLPAPNATSTDGPKATLNAARIAVRSISRSNRTSGIVVMFRGGEYFLASTVAFTSADSGTTAVPITYEAYPGENVVISGGLPVTGWTNTNGNVWMAHVNASQPFSQLWIGGQRRLRARSSAGYLKFGPTATANTFQYQGTDVNPNWSNLQNIEVQLFEFWTSSRVTISSVNASTNTVTVAGTFPSVWYKGFIPGHNYFLENVKDAFGRPGEWYFDSASQTISYTLASDDAPNPNQIEVIIPQLPNLITGSGVSNLNFNNLIFAHSSWILSASGYVAAQSDTGLTGALQFSSNSSNISFNEAAIRHVGGYGIEFQATNHFSFTNGEISDAGGGGVKAGTSTCGTDTSVPSYGTVTDNLIYATGRLFAGATPIYFGNSHNNLISHNEIFDTYNIGISLGMVWGYGCYTTHNNEVSYNLIHDYGQGVTSDFAGIYTLSSQGINNSIHHNKIYNAIFNDATADGYGGWGIYMDQGTTGTTIENNLVYNTTSPSVHLNMITGTQPPTPVSPNLVANNIFALASGMIDKNGQENLTTPFQIISLTGNIYYADAGPLGAVQSSYPKTVTNFYCEKVACTSIAMYSSNLYYDTRTSVFNFLTTQPNVNYTFAQWQALGEDRGSMIANPLFTNPAAGDFSFTNLSAYSLIGFTLFDLSTVGRRTTVYQPTPHDALYPTMTVSSY